MSDAINAGTAPPTLRAHAAREAESGAFPEALDAVLSREMAEAAQAEITSWPGYAPTPLRRLDRLAADLDLADILYKDEGERFGLGSFKALGGSYAVLRLAADWLARNKGVSPSLEDIREGRHAAALADMTVCTATDGNHGRSVAWGAQMAGCRCRIYIHTEVSQGRQQAMEALGAEVVRVDGDYDFSVRHCAQEAEDNGWFVVSDTSWEGYMDIPRNVMAGYSVMASEVLDQIGVQSGEAPPSHVFIQAGVGGVAAAVCARFWQVLGPARPRFVIVEPERAACLLASARAGQAANVAIAEETLMAGLSCGETSLLAWEVLSRGASDFVTLGEEQVAPAMRLLASGEAGGGRIVAGESAVPGLIALMGAARDPELRAALGLTGESRVLLFGCEGATDPEIYRRLVGDAAAGETA